MRIDADRQDSEPVVGRLRTAPRDRRDVTIAWSGNVVGQSWGIDPDTGGMTGFEAVRRRQPDSLLHSGDDVHADGPLQERVVLMTVELRDVGGRVLHRTDLTPFSPTPPSVSSTDVAGAATVTAVRGGEGRATGVSRSPRGNPGAAQRARHSVSRQQVRSPHDVATPSGRGCLLRRARR